MTLEAQRIKMSTMEISNLGDTLLFDGTQNISFNTGSANIFAPNEKIDLEDNMITNVNNIAGQVNTNIVVESRGTGNIKFSVPDSNAVPLIEVKTDGVTYFDTIPTSTIGSNIDISLLRWNDFTAQTTFNPTLTSDTETGSATYSTRSGVYTRIGDLVFFRAAMVITGKSGLTAGSEARFSIPIAIDYSTVKTPQALQFNSFSELDSSSCDYTCTIGGSGSSPIGSNVDYCKIYRRATITSQDQVALKISDINISGNTIIRYSGIYYIV
jgi:hypothetical protein